MATYNVTAQTRRVQYTGNGTTGNFAFAFQINATSQLKVYVDSTEKSESSHYVVTLNSSTGAGTVGFTSGNHPTSSQTVTLLSDIPFARTSVYTSGGLLTSASLEDDFDTNMFIHQQTNEEIDRSLRLAEHDTISGANMTLPVKDTRKGTVLGFNATTGNPEAGPTITAVQSLSAVATAINLLGTSAVVEDLGLLGTSAVVEDMGLLGTSANVTAMGLLGVSGVITDMGILGTSAIVEDMGFLGTSANVTAMGVLGTSDNVTAMGKLGNDTTVADMAILATDAIVADMAILANSTIVDDLAILATSAIVDDMALLATSAVIEDMGLLATSTVIEDMGLLATSAVIEDMGLLATSAVIEDMGLLGVAGVIEDMGILGTSANVTAMSNVSGSIANVNTVASNLASVNSFGNVYRIASSAPSSSLTSGDLYFNTSTNVLNVYGASGWQNAGSSVNGTSQRYHYDIGSAVTSVTGSDASSNTLAYDAGYVDVYVNGVRMSTADVTVTSGDTVTFASALASGDEVDIVAYGTFAVANLNADNLDSGTVPTARLAGAYTGITGTGALNAGSITSGFGAIDNGASAITTTGVGSFGSLDISGDIDVDGTTNLDVVDIDGAVDMASTLNVAGNVGIGVVPEAWSTTFDAIQFGDQGSIFGQNSGTQSVFGHNVYHDGAYKYITTSQASRYVQSGGSHVWSVAPSGSADSAITFNTVMSIDNAGQTNLIDHTASANNQTLVVQSKCTSRSGLHVANQNASFGNSNYGVIRLETVRSTSNAFQYAIMRSGDGSDIQFQMRGDGNAYADNNWNAGGADYAEYFEWKDGNLSSEDRRGYTVVLDGNQIRKSTSDDAQSSILGVVSATPAMVGDSGQLGWQGKHERDEWGSYILEEYTQTEWTVYDEERKEKLHSYQTDKIPSDVTVPIDALVTSTEADGSTKLMRRKESSSYDASATYIPREDRKEWDTIGLVGKLRIRVGQTVGDRWIKMREISDTVHEYLVR